MSGITEAYIAYAIMLGLVIWFSRDVLTSISFLEMELESLSDEQWDMVDSHAEWFSKEESDGTSLYNFWEATGGVGSLNIGF